MRDIKTLDSDQAIDLFTPDKVEAKDYQCLDEVTTGVVTIDALPGGFGQQSQKLAEPIDVIKTKIVEVKDGLRRSGFSKRAASEEFMRATEFAPDMVPRQKRACRDCGKDLPDDRHWHCRKCVPKLPEEDQYLYHGVTGE